MKASGGLVCQGVIDGENGKNGYNTVAVPLYRRSSSELNDGNRPSGTLTYTFSTGKLTGPSSYFNGWSQNIPTASANTKLYVIMAVARSQSDTGEIAASDWSTPVEYVTDGLNSAPVFIYKRAESVSDKPANGAVYTFATGELAGTLNGWSTNIPTTDNNHYPCWVRQAMAVSRDTSDVINASEWSDATKLVEDGVSINSADIVFCLNNSNSSVPSDSATWKMTFSELDISSSNASKYVWQATKVVLSNGTTSYTGKQCLGKVSEFASITEQYTLGTDSAATGTWQDITPPSAEKGKYLWTRTKLTYSGGGTTYVPSSSGQCIGYFGTDGNNAQYIYLKGSAFNKDSAGTNVVNSEIRVNGGNNLATQSRGLCLVTLNRQTLAVVDSATIYDTYEGTTGKNNLITKLNSLGDNVFVCLVSYDAIGWSDTLISLLQTFGMSDLPYTSANRYPFLFIGHKNLGKGNGITRMNDMAEPAIPVELGVYVANGALSVKDGEKGDTGRMYYIAGEFPQKAPYYRTDKLCPVVYYGTKWWYLDAASSTANDIPSDSSNKWKELQNYGVVLTDAIFVKQFAQFGAAIITGNWLISCHGTIGGVAYGGSVENPDQYNNRAAYTYFDPAYPQGYDPFQLPIINNEIDEGYSNQWTKVTNNFILKAGTYKFKIRCYVNSSDGMHFRLFYGSNTSDYYYLFGVTNDEPVTYEIEKTIDSTRKDWNICAGMNEDGEVGYIESIEIEPIDARFVPNYAVDLRTGKTYQSDAHIRGTITTIGPNSKVVMRDGIIEFFGSFDFPNIVLGVDADGCAILNFYDKNGRFKYGLGPEQITETLSQAESMRLTYYDIDAGSNDCTYLQDSDFVVIYRYTYKNYYPASSKCLYKYLAKISANVYGGYYVNNDDAQGRVFNGKIIKQDYDVPLRNENIYGGGIVITSSRPSYGMVSYLSSMLDGTSYDELDYRGYSIMKNGDFNINHDGYVYRFITKDTYNPIEAFYVDRLNYKEYVGYNGVYSDKWYLNLCTGPEDDDKLVDPIYWFNLNLISSNGSNLGIKTLYINRSKLKRLLQNAGYSL